MEIKLTQQGSKEVSAHTLLIIPGNELSEEEVSKLLGSFPETYSLVLMRSVPPKPREVVDFAKQLYAAARDEKLKRASVLGIGSGGSIAISLCDLFPKFVRRLILLDTSTRLEPTAVAEAIDRLEAFFPLGLPLRRLGEDFDARPILHRLHCPTLVLSSPKCSAYERVQSELIAGRVPNAWLKRLEQRAIEGEGSASVEFVELLTEFLEIAAKRPQKNKKAA